KRRKAGKRPGEAKSRTNDMLCWREGCEAKTGPPGQEGDKRPTPPAHTGVCSRGKELRRARYKARLEETGRGSVKRPARGKLFYREKKEWKNKKFIRRWKSSPGFHWCPAMTGKENLIEIALKKFISAVGIWLLLIGSGN